MTDNNYNYATVVTFPTTETTDPPIVYAVPVNEEPSTTATSSSSSSSAFFQDANGNPLFPRLYQRRRDGGNNNNNATTSTTTTTSFSTVNQTATSALQAWQRASKQALSAAQTNFQKGVKLAQSTLLLSDDNDNVDADKKQSHVVRTPFGPGTLTEFRESTATYIVKLSSGGILYTQEAPKDITEKKAVPTKKKAKKKAKTVLELNETFLEWEKARHAEVEQECEKLGIACTEETKQKCFACIKEEASKPPPKEKEPEKQQALFSNAQGKPMFPLLYKLRQ